MAAAVRLAFLADTRELVRGSAKARESVEEVGESAEKTGSKMRKALGSAGKVAAAGLVAAGAGALKLAQGAAEDAAAASKLATSLKNTTGATKAQVAATEEWISAQGRALGVADDELRPAIAKLATATGSVAKAQKLTSLAMDISAGSGKSLSSVTDALAKAQTGSVTGLRRFGIAVKNADGSTKSLTQIQDELAKKFKGQASTAANTMTGKLERAKLALSEAGETIGGTLLPPLTELATIAAEKVAPAIERAFGYIGEHRKTFTIIGVAVAAFAVALIAANAAIAVYGTVAKVITAVTKAWSIAQAALNVIMALNPVTLIVLAVIALVAIIVIVVQKLVGWGKVWDLLKKAFDKAWSAIKSGTSALLAWFKGLPARIGKALGALNKLLLEKGKDVLRGLLAGVKWIWDHTLLGYIVNRRQAIVRAIGNVGRLLYQKGKDLLGGLKAGAQWVFDHTVKPYLNLGGKIGRAVGNLGRTLYGAGKDILLGLRDGLIYAWENYVAPYLKKVTDLIPDWKGPRQRDAKLLTESGRLIMGSLVKGFDDGAGTVERYLAKFTDGIPGLVDLSMEPVALAGGSSLGTIQVKLSAEQVSQLQRGREIQLDLDAWRKAGGRAKS